MKIIIILTALTATMATRAEAVRTCADIVDSVAQDPTGSYIRLSGRRLRKFEKTKGLSESGRNIRVLLSGKALDDLERIKGKKRWMRFEEKGVVYVVDRTNPYLVQTERKVRKKKGRQIVVKGRVKVVREKTRKRKDDAKDDKRDGTRDKKKRKSTGGKRDDKKRTKRRVVVVVKTMQAVSGKKIPKRRRKS